MRNIAVLDDDEYWCLAIQRFFRNDFNVLTFRDPYYFLNQLDHFDLAIVDFSLPPARFEKETDGCTLIRQLKSTMENPPILVLATGFVSRNDLELGRKICPEADDFLVKDMGLDAALQKIKQLLAPTLSAD